MLPSQKPDELNRGKGNSACSGSLHDEFGGGQLLSELEISQYVPALVASPLLHSNSDLQTSVYRDEKGDSSII